MRFKYQNLDDKAGHYLVGVMDSWHGGIHLTGAIKALAAGEIIAYRISSEYKQETGENGEISYYSDCFVLVRHKYKYNLVGAETDEETKGSEQKEFIFYSLYLHLQVKDEMISGEDCPDFLHCIQKIKGSERMKTQLVVKKGINLRKKNPFYYKEENIKEIVGIIPWGCNVLVYPETFKENYYKVVPPQLLKRTERGDRICIEIENVQTQGYYFNKELGKKYEIGSRYNSLIPGTTFGLCFYEKTQKIEYSFRIPFDTLSVENKSEEDLICEPEGAILRKEGKSDSNVIGLIPNNDKKLRVRILEKGADGWFKIKTPYVYILKEDSKTRTIYEKRSLKEGFTGWCKNTAGQFDSYIEPEYDRIVNLENPIPVAAADTVGFASKYEVAGGRLLTHYAAAHVEVFSNDDVPRFLADMKTLVTDKNKTYKLKVKQEEFKAESFTYLNSAEYITATGKRKAPSELRLSDDGKAFIKAWEGCSLKGYLDTNNLLTIGYGNLLRDKNTGESIRLVADSDINISGTIARVDDKYIKTDAKGNKTIEISQKEANEGFDKHVSEFEDAVKQLNVDFYQWEFDAMVSLFFNTGSNVKAPSLRKYLQDGKYADAGKQFNDITGDDNEGLVYRRAAEMDLFLNGGDEGYEYFKNNNDTKRDKLVDKLNEIRKELGGKQFKKEQTKS